MNSSAHQHTRTSGQRVHSVQECHVLHCQLQQLAHDWQGLQLSPRLGVAHGWHMLWRGGGGAIFTQQTCPNLGPALVLSVCHATMKC